MARAVNGPGSFRASVVYWPARTGIFWWEHFERDTVRRDFETAALYGVRNLDINLTWREFQPDATHVGVSSLRHLETVLSDASDCGLTLGLILFPGLPRNARPLPEWTLQRLVIGAYGHPVRNLWADPTVVRGEQVFVREVTTEFGPYPCVGEWVLGERMADVCPGEAPEVEGWLANMAEQLSAVPDDTRVTWGISASTLLAAPPVGVLPERIHLRIVNDRRPPWAERAPLEVWLQFVAGYAQQISGREAGIANLGPCTTRPERPSPGCTDESEAGRALESGLQAVWRQGGWACGAAALFDYDESLRRLPVYREHRGSLTRGLFTEGRVPKEGAVVWAGAPQKVSLARVPFPSVDLESSLRDPEGMARDVFEAFADYV